MDISLLIMAAPRADSPYKVGDVISADIMHGEECSNPRFVLVNITNIPDKAPRKVLLRRVKRMLEEPIEKIDFLTKETTSLRRRAWRIRPKDIPKKARTILLRDRKITVTWGQAKKYLTRKFVVVESDPNQDTSTTIQDADI